jgi:SAM-dependent methyltransferase
MCESNSSTQAYVFGHSVGEAQSIQQLARIVAPVTRQFLEQAGLCVGMKVLEVGSGAGDVALFAAELVGPSGRVIGVENNPAILETARAQAARLTQVSFIESDLDSLDQTARDILAAGHPHRLWKKQIPAYRGKRAPTPTTHHTQAAGETASMHEHRSPAPRPAGQAGSDLAAGSHHSCNRTPCSVGIGSSFVCIGSASPRLLLTSPRSLQKPSP